MKPKCRIKVTLGCNLKCSYCINKSEEYKKKWRYGKSIYDFGLDEYEYRSIVISGGEPLTLGFPVLRKRLGEIKILARNMPPIYLQTNGMLLSKEFVKEIDNYIDGIGISVHNWDTFFHLKTRFMDISKIKPIRLYVENTKENNDRYFCGDNERKFPDVRWWNDGDFDNSEEIFVLKE